MHGEQRKQGVKTIEDDVLRTRPTGNVRVVGKGSARARRARETSLSPCSRAYVKAP